MSEQSQTGRRWLGLLILGAMLTVAAIAGCDAMRGDETAHPMFQKGRRERDARNGVAAVEAFRRLLELRPNSAKVHLELAGVYDELLDDPLSALCHYQEYLNIAPNSSDAATVKSFRDDAERRFVERAAARVLKPVVPEGPPPEAAKLAELEAENARLRTGLDECKKRIFEISAQLRAQRRAATTPPGGETRLSPPVQPLQPAAPVPPAAVGSYVVQNGDTPARIARKVYGNSQLYKKIMNANSDLLKSDRDLRAGMTLKIPPRDGASGNQGVLR